MKKEIFIHFSFLISLFVFISVLRDWMSLSYWPFWLGGIIGNFLPDLDHIIYIYFLRPQELTSQRAGYMLGKRDFFGSMNLLARTRSERTKLIFHTALFQIVFVILSFLVVTSSGSLLGRGIVLAFSLHLLIDQAVDLVEIGSLDNWFKDFSLTIEKDKAKIYWVIMLLILLVFSFLL
jgi:hypothetical protein